MATNTGRFPTRIDDLSDQQLLSSRICDLELNLEGAGLDKMVRALHAELAAAGLRWFRPLVYLGDEWFSPSDSCAISMPFYLAHPRLAALERRANQKVEGGTLPWCLKLLRHEAGHCFEHAFGFAETRTYRRLFGDPARRYSPERYRVDRKSRSFVTHLEDHYAQSHPREDFAETFAVCVTPDSDWRVRYRDWPGAIKKLQYMQNIITTCGSRRISQVGAAPMYQVSRLRRTLAKHYEKTAI